MPLPELLADEIHYFINLKRHSALVNAVVEKCAGKPIANDLIYEQMLFASLDGLIVRLVNFADRLYRFFDQVKANDDLLNGLKLNNWQGFKADEPQGNFLGEGWTEASKWDAEKGRVKMHKDSFYKTYDFLFPQVRQRNEGRPNHADIDGLKQQIVAAMGPIVAHRDTVVAHWDEDPVVATVADLKTALNFLEKVLGSLYFVCALGSYVFELGGIAASIERTADQLADLIVSKNPLDYPPAD